MLFSLNLSLYKSNYLNAHFQAYTDNCLQFFDKTGGVYLPYHQWYLVGRNQCYINYNEHWLFCCLGSDEKIAATAFAWLAAPRPLRACGGIERGDTQFDWPAARCPLPAAITVGFLKRCLVLMKAAAEKQEITPSHLALSIDRVLTHEKQKQIYGSQFKTGPDGKAVPMPIEDPKHLDERRLSMGLQPYEDYRKLFD